jgi:ornithine carbamoyltransferase
LSSLSADTIASSVIAVPEHLKGRDFLRIADWSRGELETALDLADTLKAARLRGDGTAVLPGRSLGMIFEKPSMRTRVSFDVGIAELGGFGVQLGGAEIGLGHRESLRDMAHVLERYLDGIMIRTFAQAAVEELAEHASIPVLNGLTDEEHPCQVLADLMTIRERLGRLEGVRVVYVGDGNNVCVSLMLAAALFGMRFVAATPAAYAPSRNAVEGAQHLAGASGGSVELATSPAEAAGGADVLYTDVWTSMGQEEEGARRLEAFRGFTIDEALVERASDSAIVLHCLPAHYGEEITEAVLYGPRSAVWDEAENRLHAQKALMALVIR